MDRAQAKAACEMADQNSIRRMAEFEIRDLAEEDFANATPRPPFTPKQFPQPRNQAYSGLTPMAETSDDETSDFDRGLFVPPTDEDDVDTEDDMAVEDDEVVGGYKIVEEDKLAEDEDDVPSPPPKRFKSQRTGKAAAATTKVTVGRKEKPVEVDAEMMPAPPSRKTKSHRNPKSKKGMLRAIIDMAAKKIRED